MFFKKSGKLQKKAFVSIGAGANQIPLIKEAASKGFRVIGVDVDSVAPGFNLCDLKIQESIYDYEKIYTSLSEALFDGIIIGIMTRSYGEAVKTTAFLCEKFGLPFLPFGMCANFTDKLMMKNSILSHGISTPELLSIPKLNKLNKLKDKFPPIIKKPVDGHAKKGIKLITNSDELKAELPPADSKKTFLFEKYIEGDEIIAAGIVHQGHYYLADITDKAKSADTPFIDLAHISPSKYAHLGGRVSEIGQSVAGLFSIASSPLIMEFIVDKEEVLYLIEALPEFGGEFLADIAIPKATGYNFVREAINSHTGSGFKPPEANKKKKAVAVQYMTAPDGTLQSYNKDAPLKIKGVFHFNMFKHTGERVHKPANNLDRIGVVIAADETADRATAAAAAGVSAAQVQVKQ
ncbi:MAG: ATP-grasp domain-containing protein [Spirochaetia bacterium]|jgi:biotin carboxylase|nr:ATP-grasp domain-containing protein [Spirochaetia bacterium]